MGTGIFLVEVIEKVVETLRHERASDAIPQAHLRELFAKRLVGFELQAPLAVAELRLHHILKNRYGVELPKEEARFFCNTLDDPDTVPIDFGQLYDVLVSAREEANVIKRDRIPVMVVIGNPPWREKAAGEAPWIEGRRDPKLTPGDAHTRPSLDEFRSRRQWRRAFNLNNMWTFFWRWAAWKVFDAHPGHPSGVVTLITPKAYLSSESHAGMRRYLRRTADEGWIIDLSPEGFEPPGQTRVFPRVRQQICIGIFARCGAPRPGVAARVRYKSVSGTQQAKFQQLLALSPKQEDWQECGSGWEDPFQPEDREWQSYPKLDELFLWQTTGVNANRNWVWAPERKTLLRRWSALIHAGDEEKRKFFKETDQRSIDRIVPPAPGVPSSDLPIAEETQEQPTIVTAAFHSFDRQFIILDRRVIDRPREELWASQGSNQIYISEPPGYTLPGGPALTFSAVAPYVHHFMTHDGGRVIPLYQDPDGRIVNIAPRLLRTLGEVIGIPLGDKDFVAYLAAIISHPGYTLTFKDKLATPGIHVPLATERTLWVEAIGIGREVLWLHTFGERYIDSAMGRPKGPPRVELELRPRYSEAVSASEETMPSEVRYDAFTKSITIGQPDGYQGRVEGVEPGVWNYMVGDRRVIDKWLSYRLRDSPRKKRTSKLDSINPSCWTAQFDDELLDLLNVLHRCVALEPRQADLLERVCASTCMTVDDLSRLGVLPVPEKLRKAPRQPSQPQLNFAE